ncbi:MAG: hypothetical protein AAB969_00995, partial [Patescibacteria group bacterium]
NLTVLGTFELSKGYRLNDTMNVYVAGTLTHQGNNASHEYNITFTAQNVTVASGGKITAEGRGYPRGALTQAGSGPGGGGGEAGDSVAGGGSHGGYGAMGVTASALRVYGSISNPRDLGSAGGSDNGELGGNGGGAIFINATDTLNNSGFIDANGTNGVFSAGGGGAGGSILIHANTIKGNGKFDARGGQNAYTAARSGGGGRIAVHYNVSEFTGTLTANGGVQGTATGNGGGGTVFRKARNSSFVQLIIDNGGSGGSLAFTEINETLGLDNETTEIIIGANAIVNLTGSFNAPYLKNLSVLGTFQQLGPFTALNLSNLTITGTMELTNMYQFNT